MKTFTKTMSMILIAVMCFSLFATSAYAMDFSLDGSDGSFSLDANPAPSFSADNDGSFSLSDNFDDSSFSLGTSVAQQVAPVQQAEANSDDSFTLGETTAPKADASDNSVKQDDELIFEDNEILRGEYTSDMKFESSPNAIKVTDTDAAATVTIKNTGSGTFAADTFGGGLYYAFEDGTGDSRKALPPTARQWDGSTLKILGSWLKAQPLGTYFFFGQPLGKPLVSLGFVSVDPGDVSSDYGTFTVNPNTYIKYESTALIAATATTAGKTFDQFSSYGVIPQGSSSGKTVTEFTKSSDAKTLTLGKSFLQSLADGSYDLYGRTTNGVNVKIGSFTISSGEGGYPGSWTLWPSYDIPWTSGDDPLMFRSNLMAMRKTYPRYTIVPRYGFGAGSIPNNMIDVNQFWDMGDGVFALGTNFLRSLPAGTYTLQVVDYKHLNDCTNVVTFKIGSTLRPIDTDKHVIGSIKNLRFLCDEPVYEVYVGNIPLTYGEDYALSNGNKTITLSFEFLNKRSTPPPPSRS